MAIDRRRRRHDQRFYLIYMGVRLADCDPVSRKTETKGKQSDMKKLWHVFPTSSCLRVGAHNRLGRGWVLLAQTAGLSGNNSRHKLY